MLWWLPLLIAAGLAGWLTHGLLTPSGAAEVIDAARWAAGVGVSLIGAVMGYLVNQLRGAIDQRSGATRRKRDRNASALQVPLRRALIATGITWVIALALFVAGAAAPIVPNDYKVLVVSGSAGGVVLTLFTAVLMLRWYWAVEKIRQDLLSRDEAEKCRQERLTSLKGDNRSSEDSGQKQSMARIDGEMRRNGV